MDSFTPRAAHGPEHFIQVKWVTFLEAKGWMVKRMVGNAYQSGVPDIFIAHLKYGSRFVDIKVHGRYNFTRSQILDWPIWEANGVGIWILGAESSKACTKTHMINDYDLLFKPPNMRDFWKPSYDKDPNYIDKLLDELDDCNTE